MSTVLRPTRLEWATKFLSIMTAISPTAMEKLNEVLTAMCDLESKFAAKRVKAVKFTLNLPMDWYQQGETAKHDFESAIEAYLEESLNLKHMAPPIIELKVKDGTMQGAEGWVVWVSCSIDLSMKIDAGAATSADSTT